MALYSDKYYKVKFDLYFRLLLKEPIVRMEIMHKYSKEEIISEVKIADNKSDEPLTLKDFVRMSGIKEWQIKNFFPKGGWSELKRLANIKDEPKPSIKLSRKKFAFKGKAIKKKPNLTKEYVIAEEDIIVEEDIVDEEVAEEKVDANKAAKKDADAIKAAAEKSAKEDAEAIKAAAEKSAKENAEAIKAAAEKSAKEKIVEPPISPSKQSQKGITDTIKDDIAEFGELIDFRGLRHAPINQNGVIFLFGMVSNELGFMVEAIHAAFPECEAKRHVGENRYQRVRIKFEYKSSNYMSHGYDPAGADMIVCWVHDWHDCPLEVLELQIAIDKLES
jgi:hypothetical protein